MLKPTNKAIRLAGAVLRAGGLVAFPTETVYGLGANAFDAKAVRKIFIAKGRPADNPLIVHVARKSEVNALVAHVPATARKLMRLFWPGPLTLVMKKSKRVPPVVTAGLSTVAVRMPAHPVAIALVRAAGVPIAAPSANISGKPSPTTGRHVVEDLAGRVDVIIDGGRASVGVESTVLDVTCDPPVLLRPGGVTLEQLQQALGEVRVHRGGGVARSPGMRHRHYAPKARVVIADDAKRAAASWRKRGKRVRVVACNARALARSLFRLFREADADGVDVIVVRPVPERGLGRAVMNRLRKAASRR